MTSRFAITLLFILLLSSCSHTSVTNTVDGRINHLIMLWLKDPGNLRQQQQIIQATKAMEQIPGVINIRVGRSIPSSRAIVDDSFDIGVHMLFADRQALTQYISHPEHLATVSQAIMPFVEKIVVYDFEE